MKKMLLAVILLGCTLWYFYKSNKSEFSLSQQLSPDTTVFAFDLHNVVLIPDYHAIIKLLWNDFFRCAPFSLLIKPSLWYDLYKLLRSSVSTEYIFAYLRNNGYPEVIPFENLIAHMMEAQHLNTELIPILQKLKQEGYKLSILSNIWAQSLEHLYKKFPLLKELFDGVYIPSKDNNFAAKPSFLFYKGFKDYLNKQGQAHKQVIFIDNGEDNIEEAKKAQIYGYEFTSVNNFIQFLNKHLSLSPKA